MSLRFSAALAEADQVDNLIEEEMGREEALADRFPLLGVPLSVKESFFLQGKTFIKLVKVKLFKIAFNIECLLLMVSLWL